MAATPSAAALSGPTQPFRVVNPGGVGWRNSPNYGDRRADAPGINSGAKVEGRMVNGKDEDGRDILFVAIEAADGSFMFLPTKMPDGSPVLTPIDMAGTVSKWQVVSPSGIGYRNSPKNDDRNPGQGPAYGEKVTGMMCIGVDGLQYVACPNNLYLPITSADQQTRLLNELPMRFTVVSQSGISWRSAVDFDARATATAGPGFGQTVEGTLTKDANGNKFLQCTNGNATYYLPLSTPGGTPLLQQSPDQVEQPKPQQQQMAMALQQDLYRVQTTYAAPCQYRAANGFVYASPAQGAMYSAQPVVIQQQAVPMVVSQPTTVVYR